MRGLRILLFVVIPLSFAFGVAWGWKVRRDRAAKTVAEQSSVKTVRVLALDRMIPRETIQEFEASRPVRVELNEAASPTELVAKWNDAKTRGQEPDLVTLLYSQIPDTSKELKLQPLDEKRLPFYVWISRDFVDWPHSRDWPTTAPLAWGLDGWALRKAPPGKSSLWVVTLAMTSSARDVDETHAFADWLLARSAAIQRAKGSTFASASLETEASDLDEKLKPSFLRKIPLTDYVVDTVSPAGIIERESE